MSDIYAIAASGMAAQRTQMDLIADNLANAGVVRADGGVFRPKTAVLTSEAAFDPILRTALLSDPTDGSGDFALADGDDMATGPAGVAVADIVEDERQPQYRFDPGNPFAAKSGSHAGYVMLPGVDPIQQMVALVGSGRAYDANVSMLQAAKQMDMEAADIARV
jgi:flagellar basal-body rod protein FlgC